MIAEPIGRLLDLEPEIEAILARIERERRERQRQPVWVCARGGVGWVCGTVFWDGKPTVCPKCGARYGEEEK